MGILLMKKGDGMNIEKMKLFMKEHDIKPRDVAEATNVDISTWFRKMQRKGDTITIKEMNDIIDAFEIPKAEAAEIFFDETLA